MQCINCPLFKKLMKQLDEDAKNAAAIKESMSQKRFEMKNELS